MKKTLIALAVAGVAITAAPVAMADAGAYGRLTTALVLTDDDDDAMDVQSGSSRFGFKGTEDLGNGMMGVYRFEFSVDSDQTAVNNNNRLSYAGLKGGFGEVTIGRHWAPFYEQVVGRTDTFQAAPAGTPIIGGAVTSGDTANDPRGPSIRIGDSIKYTGMFGGITVSGLVQMRDSGADDDDVDRIDLSVGGKAGAIGWGVGVVSDAESKGDDTTFGFGADFAVNKDLSIVGAVVVQDNDNFAGGPTPAGCTTTDDCGETSFSIGAIFQLGSGMQVQARFSDSDKVQQQFDVGFEKKFSKRTRLFAELQNNEPEVGDGTNIVALGIRHDF